ncbi:MAG: SDR family NAD(P)-dependent oxidoreductase [Deltaproteobacteria bacterium]|nr:SDR family NAD(P)-dependent oxidoreductase [Deltaproteobacteria bacterium]
MRDPIRQWRERGIEVVIVGNGNASFAEDFRQEFGLEAPLLVDPELVAYRAAGLRRGGSAMASPRLFRNAYRALRGGARQTAVQGDPWQLGGVFVIAPGGELRLAHRSREAGDHAGVEEIEAALEAGAPEVDESALPPTPAARAVDTLRPLLDASPLFSFDRIGFRRHALGFDPEDLAVDLYGRRCLVTGANSGIGYETALTLADLGAEVVLLCRSRDRGRAAVDRIREATGSRRVRPVEVDVSERTSIDAAVAELSDEPIDVLVHNAGVLPDSRIETKDGLELCFATHVAGPHHLTRALQSELESAEGARVIWVSSGGMLTRRLNVDDPDWREREYDGVIAYAETKRAQVVLAELWAEELAETRVCVNSMHPGWADTPAVRTSLPRFHRLTETILRTPAEGADTVVWLAASPAAEGETGHFFFDRRAVRSHWTPTTRESDEDRDRLWALCEAL